MKAKKIEWKNSNNTVKGYIDGNIYVGKIVSDETFGFELIMDIGKRTCPAGTIEKAKNTAQDYMNKIMERMSI